MPNQEGKVMSAARPLLIVTDVNDAKIKTRWTCIPCCVIYDCHKKGMSARRWCHVVSPWLRAEMCRVIDAFILEETLYWCLHPIERVQTVRGIDAWDGYHWTLTQQMAQDGDWVSLKLYMDTMGETYLREYMEHLIQSASPCLYHDYWTACLDNDHLEHIPPNDHHFVKMGVGSWAC